MLIDAVRTVAGGEALLEPSATRRLIEAYVGGLQSAAPAGFPLPSSLTAREVEILRLIAAGLTNTEIAERLFISPLTCKSHVSRILTKLDARDRTQLVILAYESGLIVSRADRRSSRSASAGLGARRGLGSRRSAAGHGRGPARPPARD